MVVVAFAFVSREVATGPLGPVAPENRRHLIEQSTEPQVLACLPELGREQMSGGDPALLLYCESYAVLRPFTNPGPGRLLPDGRPQPRSCARRGDRTVEFMVIKLDIEETVTSVHDCKASCFSSSPRALTASGERGRDSVVKLGENCPWGRILS
jgi:hypothetical protein